MWLFKTGLFIENAIKKLSWLMNKVGAYVLLLLMILTAVDVTGRFFFSKPFRGTFELTELALVLIVLFALGHALLEGRHISIDTVVNRLSAGSRAKVETFVYFVSAIVFALVVWEMCRHANNLKVAGAVTGVLSLPIYVFVLLGALGALVFMLLFLLYFLKSLKGVCGK
ncbi:MAG TPA: TRAP transporter small permease [Firmicutes bacterium]|nr:TRAP transporter small permease [Bacillota bacterium]